MNGTEEHTCNCCFTSTENCIHSRRCFMTGEYCSKQTNIQKDRKRLHDKNSINAFVVMNFSNMSDVVYKWRLQSFIESLSKYLYMDGENKKLYCLPTAKPTQQETQEIEKKKWEQVEKVNVIRSDSNPASNYVICNRVCQQLQIADLVIVDVSVENTNVFYEFGMAVALGKMILPICYSESFYEIMVPEVKESREAFGSAPNKERINEKYLEHHIGRYPWKKNLFEYYGIRYRNERADGLDYEAEENRPTITQYLKYDWVTRKEYCFSDIQYSRFPYHEIIKDGQHNPKGLRIGEQIYNRLRETYNKAKYLHNTLVVYTMEGFLNETQAGQCIINFYKNITLQMKREHCFCGDRVGILIQGNAIPEDMKDAKTDKNLLYGVGEIIRIGMNQATYIASKGKIKTEDFLAITDHAMLDDLSDEEKDGDGWEKDIIRFTKEHIRNKSMSIYPDNPIYVSRVKNGLQKDILSIPGKNKKNILSDEGRKENSLENYFCLYHVMLRTLKYTNEIVVDISKNSLQSLFWLGAAHGSDVYAITVRHKESDEERMVITGSPEKRERDIFDVSGLWAAILRSNDTEGFYRQLALVQLGIEQHTKLMIKNLEYYENRLLENLYKPVHDISEEDFLENASKIQKTSNYRQSTKQFVVAGRLPACLAACSDRDLVLGCIKELLDQKEREEAQSLESYYRDRFWRPMLKYNKLCIYLPQVDDMDLLDEEPRLHIVKWDVDAVAALSHYLSKRKIIGEYHFKTLPKNIADKDAENLNFICVGDAARPVKRKNYTADRQSATESLAEYIYNKINGNSESFNTERMRNVIHERDVQKGKQCVMIAKDQKLIYKGFARFGSEQPEGIYTQLPYSICYDRVRKTDPAKSAKDTETPKKYYHNIKEIQQGTCEFRNNGDRHHIQIAQLILWREVPENEDGKVYYRVALTGASGPATLALAALLVDDEQKEDIFRKKEEREKSNAPVRRHAALEEMANKKLLSHLQENIRKKLTEVYLEKLDIALKALSIEVTKRMKENGSCIFRIRRRIKEPQMSAYITRVKYAASMYLSTLLYQYFFPFLSIEDEYRICNGMRTYIANMMAAGLSPFALDFPPNEDKRFSDAISNKSVREVAALVTSVLEDVLKSFRGIEAFYQVKVYVDGKNEQNAVDRDTRRVEDICELKDDRTPTVSCLFVE